MKPAAALLFMLLPGCIVIPHAERPLEGVAVPPAATSTIRTEVTTREDVLHLLGTPNRVDEDGRYFFYQWRLSSALWLAAVGGPYSAAIIGGQIPSGSDSVCIEFDGSDRVVRWGRVHSDRLIKSFEKTAEGWKQVATPPPAAGGPAP